MAILYLIIFSTLAITGYYFLANKLGFTQSLEWDSIESAKEFFLKDYDLGELTSTEVTQSCLCNKKQTALMYFDQEKTIGLVNSHGNRWLTYLIDPKNLRSCQIEAENLVLEMQDYILPKIKLSFTDEPTCKQWQKIFTVLQ